MTVDHDKTIAALNKRISLKDKWKARIWSIWACCFLLFAIFDLKRPGTLSLLASQIVLYTAIALSGVALAYRLKPILGSRYRKTAEIEVGAVSHVPRRAEMCLLFLLPRTHREAIPGDLEQEFQRIALTRGARAARRWYWWQALGIIGKTVPLSAILGLLMRLM